MKAFLLGFLCAGIIGLDGLTAGAQGAFRGKPTPLGALTVYSMPDECGLTTAFTGTNHLSGVSIKRVKRVQYDIQNTAGQSVESWTLYYPSATVSPILGAATPTAYLDRAGQSVNLGGEPYATLLNAGYGRYDYNEDAPWIIDYEPDHLTFTARTYKTTLPPGARVGWFKSGSTQPTFAVYFNPARAFGEVQAVAVAGNSNLNGTVIGPVAAAGAEASITVKPPGMSQPNQPGKNQTATNAIEFIDRDGNPIPETTVPDALRQAVKILHRFNSGFRPAALVLGWVVLPAPETNRFFNSELAGATWLGGQDYAYELEQRYSQLQQESSRKRRLIASQAYQQQREEESSRRKLFEMAVCMELNDFRSPSHVEISKLGYLNAEVELPYLKAAGKIIWLGNIPMQPGYPKDTGVISGQIVLPNGGPLAEEGVVHLTMPRTRGSMADVRTSSGRFTFPKVPPGNWRISFSLEHYSVKPSFVVVEPGTRHIEQTLTAVPYYGLTLEMHAVSKLPWQIQVSPGGGQRDASVGVDFLGRAGYSERLRFSQSGDEFNISDNTYSVGVVKGPFQSLAASKTDSTRSYYSGVLRVGDLIVLSDRYKGGVVAVAEVTAMNAIK